MSRWVKWPPCLYDETMANARALGRVVSQIDHERSDWFMGGGGTSVAWDFQGRVNHMKKKARDRGREYEQGVVDLYKVELVKQRIDQANGLPI